MLERSDSAGRALRRASLLEALREQTKELHTRAERSGIIADILHGRATRDGYVLLLQNLLPVYRALEAQLAEHAGSPLVGPFVPQELPRADSIEADLRFLAAETSVPPALPATADYVDAIMQASGGDGSR